MKLVPVNPDNIDDIVLLKVKPEQEKVIDTNVNTLAEAYAHRDFARVFGLEEKGTYVGMCVLFIDPEEDDYLVWRLMIDQKEQGKGYGTKAMQEVISYFKSINAPYILLSHQENNPEAGEFYQSLGFTYTGKIEDSEVYMIYPLSKKNEQ